MDINFDDPARATWVTTQFVPLNTSLKAWYRTHPSQGSSSFSITIVGYLVQHRYHQDFPHPLDSRVVYAIGEDHEIVAAGLDNFSEAVDPDFICINANAPARRAVASDDLR